MVAVAYSVSCLWGLSSITNEGLVTREDAIGWEDNNVVVQGGYLQNTANIF